MWKHNTVMTMRLIDSRFIDNSFSFFLFLSLSYYLLCNLLLGSL